MRASDQAYASLRDDILEWRLLPGAPLGEVEQSMRLGISRTPLREALARLTSDGLVEALPGRGLVVTAASIESVAQLFEVREALEAKAASLAAERGDRSVFEPLLAEFREATQLLADPTRHGYYDLVRRFDDAIDDAVGNSYLVSALRGLRTHLARIRRLARDNPERLAAAAAEHLLIAEAIVAGDAELARSATIVHLHQSLRTILATAEAGGLSPSTVRTA